ncbi:MAG: hypothetical protein PWP09_1577 [Thermotogota bacterium]|nr:hypothetical protein [Thermotogota bacterium]
MLPWKRGGIRGVSALSKMLSVHPPSRLQTITPRKKEECSSIEQSFYGYASLSSSQALTNDRFQKDSTSCFSFLLAASMRFSDRLYECLLRRHARLRKLHAGTLEEKTRFATVEISAKSFFLYALSKITNRALSCAILTRCSMNLLLAKVHFCRTLWLLSRYLLMVLTIQL